MAIPTVEDVLGVSPPVLVRKVNRASHWDSSSESIDNRVKTSTENVFPPDTSNTYSLYLVEHDIDLYRVAIGFNSRRSKLYEDLYLVGFTIDELDQCELSWMLNRDDETLCFGANKLHVNAVANRDSVQSLCRLALRASRKRGKFSKGKMKSIIKLVGDDGCRAVDETSSSCKCD